MADIGYFGVKLVVQRAGGTLLAGLGGLQPLGWDPPLIQLTALPAGRYRRGILRYKFILIHIYKRQ